MTHGRQECSAWSPFRVKGHKICVRQRNVSTQGHRKCNKVEVFVRFSGAAAHHAPLRLAGSGKVTRIVHTSHRIEIDAVVRGNASVEHCANP